MRTNLNPNLKFTNSDVISLTEIETDKTLAFITSDSQGNFDWRGIVRAPLDRNAIQTATGSNKYSDLSDPWMSIPDEEWSGGRANKWWTDDTTRFLDSKRAQTAFKGIFLAPLDYYSDGFRNALTNCPGSVVWRKLLPGSEKYITVQITPSKTITIGEIYIHLRRRGTPASPLTVRLLDKLVSPAVLASKNWTTSLITDTVSEFPKFTFTPVTLTAGKSYYLQVYSGSGDADNHWEVGTSPASNRETFTSPDGSDYTLANFELYYRAAEAQTNKTVKFFTYHQLQFMIRQDPNSNPALWMNGDIGSLTGASLTTLTDSTKNWDPGQWIGAKIMLTFRYGSHGHVSVWRTITANTTDTITINKGWDITPGASHPAEYLIVDTPHWKEITGHGLTAYINDIHVIRDTVYFCQGDYVNMRKMRIHEGAFQWQEMTGIKAAFIQSVRDTGGMMLWIGHNDDTSHNRSVERAALLDWEPEVRTIAQWQDPNEEEETEEENIGLEPDDGVVFTEPFDFTTGDYDFKRLKINVAKFTSGDNKGTASITYQGSEDNTIFKDIETLTVNAPGNYYLTTATQYRYRRFKLEAAGVWIDPDSGDKKPTRIDNITITTELQPHFEDRITLFDNYGKITRLFEYGSEQYKNLWIFQEGMVSSINKVDGTTDTYTLDRINIDELQTTADEWNGTSPAASDVYLLFNWLNGIQRYYNTQLEGKGPDKEEGLPADRKGRISKILPYPSNFFAAVDAGANGYSSVLMYNQSGWHEIYRAPNKGERIHDLAFQPIYGDRPDRLWIHLGDDVIWLAMPSKTLNALQDPNAEYTHESVVISSWMTGGMMDIVKQWQTMKIMADDLVENHQYVEADYQLDNETAWHPIENFYITSPSQKEDIASNRSVEGKRFRYRLRIQSDDYTKTPHVNVVVIEAVGRVDIKYSYAFTARNIKWKSDLNGEYEEIEPVEVQNIIDRWANDLTKLRLNCRYKIFDNKIVYLDASQTSVLNELQEGYLASITVNEL